MKKLISIILAFAMLFTLAACGGSEEKGVTITNNLSVDLGEIKAGISDGSINGTILTHSLPVGESTTLSLRELCDDTEGFLNIIAVDDEGNFYQFMDAKLYDGVEVSIESSGTSVYMEYPYNDSIAQCSGQFIPAAEGAFDPSEFNAEDFYGSWKYIDFDMWLDIYGDGTFRCYDSEGEIASGSYYMDEDILVAGDDMSYYLTGDGHMVDGSGDVLAVEDSSSRPGSEYWGVYETPDGYLRVYEDGTFDVTDFDGQVYNSGNWESDDGLSLYSEGQGQFFVLDENNNLYGGGDFATLIRVDKYDIFTAPSDGHDKSDYLGFWKYSNGYILQISEYDEWNLYTADGMTMLTWGPVEYDEEAAYLVNGDGSSGGGVLRFDESGNLTDSGEALTYWGEFLFGGGPEGQLNNSYMEGEWLYSDQENILYFDGVDKYVWEFPEYTEEGTYSFDGEYVTFYTGEGTGEARLDLESGQLFMTGDAGSYYYRNEY